MSGISDKKLVNGNDELEECSECRQMATAEELGPLPFYRLCNACRTEEAVVARKQKKAMEKIEQAQLEKEDYERYRVQDAVKECEVRIFDIFGLLQGTGVANKVKQRWKRKLDVLLVTNFLIADPSSLSSGMNSLFFFFLTT